MWEDTHYLLEEVAAASENVRFMAFNIHANTDLAQDHALHVAPAQVILAEQEDGTHLDFGIVFLGISSGYELIFLIKIMLLVSSGQSRLQQATLETLNEREPNVDIQVIVTPTCPFCRVGPSDGNCGSTFPGGDGGSHGISRALHAALHLRRSAWCNYQHWSRYRCSARSSAHF